MIRIVIKKEHGKYYLLSKSTGRNLGGPYNTMKEVVEREKQVNYFKHAKKK